MARNPQQQHHTPQRKRRKERNWRSRLIVRSVFALTAMMGFAFAISLVQLWGHVALGAKAAHEATSYEHRVVAPQATILVIGDSTAFGTGAQKPEETAAGSVAAAFPRAQLLNFGVNGANVQDTADRVEQLVQQGFTADVVVLHAGGNDVLGFTPYKELKADLERLLTATERITDRSYILHGGDVSTLPNVPIWLQVFYKPKSEEVRDLYIETTAHYETEYIDYFQASRDVFSDPVVAERLISGDGLHPSSQGYAFWSQPIIHAIRARCEAELFGLIQVTEEQRMQCAALLSS